MAVSIVISVFVTFRRKINLKLYEKNSDNNNIDKIDNDHGCNGILPGARPGSENSETSPLRKTVGSYVI